MFFRTPIRSFLLCIFSLLVLSLSDLSAQSGENKVRLTSQKHEGYYDIYVENPNPYDITLVLKVSGENFRTSKEVPHTSAYKPHSKSKALRIYIAEKGKKFRYRTRYEWFMGDYTARHNDSYIYSLPFKSGTSYKLIQGFNGSFSHKGTSKYALDFKMPEGTPVHAAREGTVIQTYANSNIGGPSETYSKDSNFIIIRHEDGTIGEYAHLRQNGVLVEIGEFVRKGEKIGLSGNTGYSTGPHLHFMVSRVLEDGTWQSLPVRFRSKRGLVYEPKKGEIYTAQ